MTTPPPQLTDRAALLRNRARALQSAKPAMFLQDEAILEVQDRLIAVNRTFTTPLIVTGFPTVWATAFPDAKVIEDEEVLDIREGEHDLAIHGLSLHWANDPVGQLVQIRRALKPDGLLLSLCFGGETLQELRACLAQAESELCGGLSPRVAPMGEIRDLGALVQRAGFALPVADRVTKTVTYPSPIALMQDLRNMGETNAMTARSKRFLRKNMLLRASELYFEYFGTEEGRIRASFEFVVLTGWAPDVSQPQPLRPGAATTRLSEVLNTEEHVLGREENH